jgi:thioesterase domain-containing protein
MKQLTWVEVLLNLVVFLSLIPESSLDEQRVELLTAFPELRISDKTPNDMESLVRWIFDRADQARLVELHLEVGAFARWVTVATVINGTGRAFKPQGKIKGALTTVFCAIPLPSMGTREEFKNDRLSAWKAFSGPNFEMVDVDGQHYTMLSDEHVVSFASHMRGALARAEKLAKPQRSLPSPTMVRIT